MYVTRFDGQSSSDVTVLAILSRSLGDPSPSNCRRVLESYRRGSSLFVAVDGAEPVGLVGMSMDGDEVVIRHIAVAPERERGGVGRRLIEYARIAATGRSLVAETDRGAVGFYQRLGFSAQSLGEKYPGVGRFRCRWTCPADYLVLRAATPGDPIEVWEMLQEIGPGENGFQNGGYHVARGDWGRHLAHLVDESAGVGLKQGYVPQTTSWLFLEGRPVGISKMRHFLTDKLLVHGGHIGYCIRPTARGKGLADRILALTLERARAIGIERVLVTCDEANLPSRRTIEGARGELENVVEGRCRYWISLEGAARDRETRP